ncbi:hypothetical protein [Streptomyces sp. NPDC001889]
MTANTTTCTCGGSGTGGFFAADDADIRCEGCGERVQINCETSCGRCCHHCHLVSPCD